MSLQVSDYLDQYVTICNERSIPVINSFKKVGDNPANAVPEVLFLHGTLPDLRQHRITDASMDTFLIPLAKAGSFVRELDLGCNELGDKGAQLLATFLKDDASLEGLRLNANDIGPQGATSLANALHFNDRLNFLDLSNNNIGDEGGMALANALQINTTLTQLSLVNTSLSGNSLIGLATVLRNNTSLITLDISNNRTQRSISNDVINHICKMLLVNYTLREIRLSKMGIDDWQCVEFVAPALKKNLRLYAADLSWYAEGESVNVCWKSAQQLIILPKVIRSRETEVSLSVKQLTITHLSCHCL
ncbi:hypothetical protein BC832DRAFT_534322 [Gaertneriomyces semiglobifer]|nr:hypothetical protein BC832DRAFT_534322 [Gaertneriomyces semiglobifer]